METERPRKRQRTHSDSSLPTPPASEYEPDGSSGRLLKRATNVLSTTATALAHVAQTYETNEAVRESLIDAVNAMVKAHHAERKLIVCAVGKSAHIGMKFSATCKSLGIASSFMHACEAAHGDLGDVRSGDVVLFVSFSGRTLELLNILPHLPTSVQLIAISSQIRRENCELLAGREDGILLPAPILQPEEATFGVGAPTTSTTVALAVTDMLALSIADEIHAGSKQQIFKRNHPGGAIGMRHQELQRLKGHDTQVTILELPSPTITAEDV